MRKLGGCSVLEEEVGGLMTATNGTLRTWFVIVSTLCLVMLAPVDADMKRNAGRRAEGGMGLDLTWYCQQRWGDESRAINVDGTSDGWKCSRRNRRIELPIAEACKAHYGNTAVARVASTRKAEDLYCVLGLNLTAYCQSEHGASAQAVKRNPSNPNSWKCRKGNGYEDISMRAACRHHYGDDALPVLGRHDDPQAWTCETR
jgi:hypothetical protein